MKKEVNLKNAMKAYIDMKWAVSSKAKEDEIAKKANAFKLEEAKITPIVDAEQGKAKERRINVEGIIMALCYVEETLDISKKSMDGIEVRVNYHAHRFPRAYQYRPMATIFTAKFKRDHWVLTDVWRGDCNDTDVYVVTHTDDSRAAIIRRFTRF